MAESVGKRIQRIMDEKGITREELQLKTQIVPKRLSEILDSGFSPSEQEGEYAKIARVLGVYQIELRDSYAQEFGQILRIEGDYECFQKLYPEVASLPQREAEDLDPLDERFQSFCRETLDTHWDEGSHLWNRDEEFPYWLG